MVNQLNKEIEKKVDEIVSEIETSEVYQKYLSLKDKMEANKELMELINKVRIMQQDVIHKKKNEKDLELLMDELNREPLYVEYKNTVDEINDTFTIIENSLNNYFDKIIN